MTNTPDGDQIEIRAGNIYLHVGVCEKYFCGLETVAILARDGDLLILPIMQRGGGGLLLKVRNRRGDRVIHAWEALQTCGLDEHFVATLDARWDSDVAALRVTLPAAAQT